MMDDAETPECPARRFAAGSVRWTDIDGIAVVMDLNTGRYLLLDRTATVFWTALLGEDPPSLRLDQAQAALGADRACLAEDIAEFDRDCQAKGLLVTTPAASRPNAAPNAVMRRRPLRILLGLRAWWALCRTVLHLKTRRFASLYEEYGNMPRPAPGSAVPADVVQRAIRSFIRAENACPLKRAPDDCLPRSLALYRFLLRLGIDCRHCIGVRRTPFYAHAWVELNGSALLEPAPNGRPYHTLARM